MSLKQLFTSAVIILALANGLSFALSHQKISLLLGSVEKNNGYLRLNLINNSSEEFRGYALVGTGGDSEQKEIGRAPITIKPNENLLLRLSSVPATDGFYKLAIYQSIDQREKLVFFKIAPIKSINDSSPETSISLLPSKSTEAPKVRNGISQPLALETDDPPPAPEVQVKPQLLAGTGETEPFIISFDFTSQRPVFDAKLSLTVGKFKEAKPVSIDRQANLQIKLPDQLDSELFVYMLTSKDGRTLAKGEIELGQLMSDDFVTAADIRTDREAYAAGDSVRVTLMLEGKSKRGYRVEAIVKNGQGNIIHADRKLSSADETAASQEFNFNIPPDSSGPIIFEFKIYDSESGLLCDSGERKIPLNKK